MTFDTTPVLQRLSRLVMLAAGWTVAIATSYTHPPVESTSADVTLAAGAGAPRTAVVEVAFLGAFVDQRKFVCAFVPDANELYDRLADVGVTFDPVALDAGVRLEGGSGELGATEGEPITSQYLHTCAELTCVDEPWEAHPVAVSTTL